MLAPPWFMMAAMSRNRSPLKRVSDAPSTPAPVGSVRPAKNQPGIVASSTPNLSCAAFTSLNA